MDTFEVEIKFRVQNVSELEGQLRQIGGTGFGEPVTESDSFFQHPCRNFAQTDECLRLRQRTLPDGSSEHSLTHKGPKIDISTKTRQEIEIPITEPERWESLLTALGFNKSASIQKFRRRQGLIVQNRHVEILFDTLPALPVLQQQFVEMEILASDDEVEKSRKVILDLAEQLGLSEPIRDSYLKLVQNHDV